MPTARHMELERARESAESALFLLVMDYQAGELPKDAARRILDLLFYYESRERRTLHHGNLPLRALLTNAPDAPTWKERARNAEAERDRCKRVVASFLRELRSLEEVSS